MSTIYWTGDAVAVAQVATATFATYDVTTTRSITIGDVEISAADSGGTLTTALAALAVLLNASTHPYFSSITWSSNATQIIGTSDVAGMPFTFIGAVSGGTGTVSNAYNITTANAGPNDWTTVGNWSGGALPADGDTVIFKDSSINVCWGLAQSAIEPALLRIDKTYTGRIGLNRMFATTAAGASNSTTTLEYRDQYLQIGPVLCEIGQNFGAAQSSGSGRIKIDFGTDATTCTVFDTATAPSDTGQTAVQLLVNANTSDIFVRSAPGGVGIAIGPGEASVARLVSISDITTASKVLCGPGTTLTTWTQKGGTNFISPAATITTVTVEGGELTIEGASAITTMNVYGGTVYSNTTGTIGTLAINGQTAVADFQESTRTRTVTTLNLSRGALKADGAVLTVTTFNDPANKYTVTAA
jgi:hypothetical protein